MAQPGREVGTSRRVVVALDAGAPGRAALEAAAAIAAAQNAELVAVFVVDPDLLHLAQLPFAHEIGIASATRRALDARVLERSLRALAEEARRSVATIAQRLSLQWSFRIARGLLDEEALAAAAQADLIIEALSGCGRAALQLAAVCRVSERGRLLRARTRGELELLRREIPAGA